MDDISALEHATLKLATKHPDLKRLKASLTADMLQPKSMGLIVPYENLNKNFRNCQKVIDREVLHVVQATNELDRCLDNKDATVGSFVSLIDNVVDKLTILKRKANEAISLEEESAQVCKKRLAHLKERDRCTGSALSLWKKKRVDRMLVEYFLRAGYYETAVKLARHSEIEDLTNISLFLVSKEVEESLLRRETVTCLAWCNSNKSKLKKIKSTLEFNLRVQEFIELIRTNRRQEAITHARKYFTNTNPDAEQLSTIKRIMGLLAFQPGTSIPQYRKLLDGSRWQELVDQFREENYKLFQLNTTPVLTVTLEAGLAAMKTPQCYSDDCKNPKCPVCSKYLNELAKTLPYAHCAQSRLVCSISGKLMNEHNPPMMLPNGRVYAEESLQALAAVNNGKIICPKTKEEFTLEQMEKVFIM